MTISSTTKPVFPKTMIKYPIFKISCYLLLNFLSYKGEKL